MAAESFVIDPVHSGLNFWIRHLMVSKVHGRFAVWSGALAFDEKNPASSHVEVSIDTASIDTKDPQRDGHLRSADFFDAAKYPKITFKSTRVEGAGEGQFKVTGDLTMHGATKPVTLDVEYGGRLVHPQMGERAGFSAKATLNRKDFGLTWNQVLDAGGVALGEKIEVTIDVEATKS